VLAELLGVMRFQISNARPRIGTSPVDGIFLQATHPVRRLAVLTTSLQLGLEPANPISYAKPRFRRVDVLPYPKTQVDSNTYDTYRT
jgi:hypothetical protein